MGRYGSRLSSNASKLLSLVVPTQRTYTRSRDATLLLEGWGYVDPWTPMRNSSAQEMRRHYWAATSWMDYNVGRLLGELERAKQNALTIVVFHSVRCRQVHQS